MTTTDIASGRLDDFLLPEDGYTVEQATQAEAAERERARRVQSEEQQRQHREQPVGRTAAALQNSAAARAAAEQEEQEALLARLEVTADELEETVAILNAQPGLDFVPGLDDQGESLQYHKSYGRTNATDILDGADDDELVEKFREIAVERLREVKELVEGE